MRKTLFAASLASAVMAAPAAFAEESPHSFSANVGFYSEYIFRGVTQTAGEPALQGGFDYSHSSGLYLGTWASNISWLQDFGAYSRSSLEWDFYGGYSGSFGGDFGYDIGTIYYYYPGNKNPGIPSADTWEVYAGASWKGLGVKYSYALSDYFAQQPTGQKNDGSWYLDFSFTYEIPNTGLSLVAHYGILDISKDGTEATATEASYNDWKLGVAYTVQQPGMLKDVEIGAYYTDTDIKSGVTGTNWYTDLTGYDTAKSAFVFYAKKSF